LANLDLLLVEIVPSQLSQLNHYQALLHLLLTKSFPAD